MFSLSIFMLRLIVDCILFGSLFGIPQECQWQMISVFYLWLAYCRKSVLYLTGFNSTLFFFNRESFLGEENHHTLIKQKFVISTFLIFSPSASDIGDTFYLSIKRAVSCRSTMNNTNFAFTQVCVWSVTGD